MDVGLISLRQKQDLENMAVVIGSWMYLAIVCIFILACTGLSYLVHSSMYS